MDRGKIIPSTCTWSGPYPTGIKTNYRNRAGVLGSSSIARDISRRLLGLLNNSEAGAYSAGSETVRGKRSRRDGYSAEPLFIWIARKKVCLSFFQRVPRRAGSSDLI
jgi:hypothetical protein